jgi:REP element-mobilizing transposase RayT
METKFYSRKLPRLKNYDYTQSGCYFLTICTKDKQHLLGKIVGSDALVAPNITTATVQLSEYGILVKAQIDKIETHYHATVENYVIMPNHVHLLITINGASFTDNSSLLGVTRASLPTVTGGANISPPATTIPNIISALKSIVTKSVGKNIWQESYHDHIIRDEEDMVIRWQYIDNNPAKWIDDTYYTVQIED